ncbi:ferritin-like fold-containing protein [Arthrobacter sp. 35W]|uniref:ferritin-like fold-containing protein n=1 Tax=Arthrobacter sp. 35W TaxID=1132441 RepID=UPI00042490E4|nr:ferritin-like fold-containing protein [Arthrobacter sp. 35W]
MSIPQGESAPVLSSGEFTARYDKFVVDLLGVMAYGELSSFERLSSDARYSPTLHDRATLGAMAVREFEHFEVVSARLSAMGLDPELAMRPFQASIDAFHDRTRPADWYESLMKAYVVDAISGDFYQSISTFLDAETSAVIEAVRTPEESSALLQSRLKLMLAEDPRLSSRLALWGRRLVGEALTQAQRVGREHSFLMGLLPQEAIPATAVPALMSALTRNHSKRMSQLGLTA